MKLEGTWKEVDPHDYDDINNKKKDHDKMIKKKENEKDEANTNHHLPSDDYDYDVVV